MKKNQELQMHLIESTWLGNERCGWGNGYVLIPIGHPLHGKSYDEINDTGIYVHGWLTFSNIVDKKTFEWALKAKSEMPADYEGMWIIGFDTAHHMDTKESCPREYVEKETLSLKQQIEKLYPWPTDETGETPKAMYTAEQCIAYTNWLSTWMYNAKYKKILNGASPYGMGKFYSDEELFDIWKNSDL